jgi:hypothetical protein
MSGGICDLGDMDCDGQIVGDDDDIQAFAMALMDIDAYFDQYLVFTIAGGDLDDWEPGRTEFGNGHLDFDDIDDFVRLHSAAGSGATLQKVLAAIIGYGQIPEPSSGTLLLCGTCLLSICNNRRRAFCERHR